MTFVISLKIVQLPYTKVEKQPGTPKTASRQLIASARQKLSKANTVTRHLFVSWPHYLTNSNHVLGWFLSHCNWNLNKHSILTEAPLTIMQWPCKNNTGHFFSPFSEQILGNVSPCGNCTKFGNESVRIQMLILITKATHIVPLSIIKNNHKGIQPSFPSTKTGVALHVLEQCLLWCPLHRKRRPASTVCKAHRNVISVNSTLLFQRSVQVKKPHFPDRITEYISSIKSIFQWEQTHSSMRIRCLKQNVRRVQTFSTARQTYFRKITCMLVSQWCCLLKSRISNRERTNFQLEI